MCCLTFEYAAWYLFTSDLKNATTLVAFSIYLFEGLICSFVTSCFNEALAPSTSPFPWLVKFQINWHPLRWFVKLVRLGCCDRKYHAFALLNWSEQPSFQTMWLLGMHLWLCRWLQRSIKTCWQIMYCDSCHLEQSSEHPWSNQMLD